MWNSFEKNKDALAKQYRINCWSRESGMDAETLRSACYGILEECAGETREMQKAKVLSYILCNARIEVNPKEWFADKIDHGSIVTDIRTMWRQQVDREEMKEILEANAAAQEQMVYTGDVDFSHTSPDWDAIMKLGVPGLLERIRTERRKKQTAGGLTEEQKNFYDACEMVYEGVLCLIERFAAEAERIAATGEKTAEGFGDSDTQQSLKMRMVAANLRRLTVSAPESLPEAMQLTFLFYYLQTYVEGENVRSLGGLDTLYEAYYRNDLESGRYTKEQIRELLKYYFYKFYALGANSNTPFYLAGMQEDGTGILNELSYLLLEVYGELNIHDPKVHIRCYPGIPDDFLKKALELIRKGNNSIVFMNDEVVIGGLVQLGQELSEARRYVPVGCYEPASMGKEVPCSCNGRVNVPKAVELAVSGGTDLITGQRYWDSPEQGDSFEAFYDAVKYHLAQAVNRTMELINGYERQYGRIVHAPLFSATMQEAVEAGKDVYLGGAKYNNSSINVLSIADAVDSIVAVKKLVFEEKTVTLEELAAILRQNWETRPDLQKRCRRLYPKYGNNAPEADEIMKDLVSYAADLINNKPNGRGGIYRCGFFTIDWYTMFGAKTGAAPNGRNCGEPLSKNMCAVVGQDKNGVTDLIHTATKLDYTKVPNGTVLDLMLHTSAVRGEEGMQAMLGIVKTYLAQGGMAIQINVLNPSVLKKAQQEPERYATLQIRLCGWNVYFVNLSKEEQDEFIRRAEHTEGMQQ